MKIFPVLFLAIVIVTHTSVKEISALTPFDSDKDDYDLEGPYGVVEKIDYQREPWLGIETLCEGIFGDAMCIAKCTTTGQIGGHCNRQECICG